MEDSLKLYMLPMKIKMQQIFAKIGNFFKTKFKSTPKQVRESQMTPI